MMRWGGSADSRAAGRESDPPPTTEQTAYQSFLRSKPMVLNSLVPPKAAAVSGS